MPEDSARLLTTLPDKFRADFVERLDRRTSIAKAVLERIHALESDAGGAEGLSHARRSLIRRVTWLEMVVEHAEQRLATGQEVDVGRHTQAVNALVGLYRVIGLERRQRPLRSLREVMAEESEA
jgi:hypothetical protein